MSFRNKPYRDKSNRCMVLEKESEKLRREISELEDALILHSRYEEGRDKSVRGLIRKEIGTSHWEHGGEGKMQTYRSQQDLCDGTQNSSRRNVKQTLQVRKSRQSERKRQNVLPESQEKTLKTSKNISSVKNNRLPSGKSEKAPKDSDCDIDLKISSVKAEWNLSQINKKSAKERDFLTTEDPSVKVNSEEVNSIRDLKSKVLAKATAQILNRSGHGKSITSFKKSSLDIQNTPPKDKMVVSSHQGGDAKVNSSSEMKIEDNQIPLRKREFIAGGQKNSELHKLSLHYEPSFLTKDRSFLPEPEQCLSSNLPETDDFKKRNMSFDETFWDKNWAKGTMPENPGIKTKPCLDLTLPSILGESSGISCCSNVKSNSDGALIVQPASNKQREKSPSDDASPPLDEEVSSWLQSLGLHSTQHYVDLFAHHQIDMASIKLLTATQLREMGIHALGPIMKIIKGVQILGRRNSIDDVAHGTDGNSHAGKKDIEQPKSSQSQREFSSQKISGFGNHTSSENIQHRSVENNKFSASLNEGEQCRNSSREKKVILQRPQSFKKVTQGKKSVKNVAESGWKETFDQAEFLNLNDRSPVSDLDVPVVVAVREKEDQEKHAISQTKIKKYKNTGSKLSKKPPSVSANGKATDDGVLSAAQKNNGKHGHHRLIEKAEGKATTRRKEIRDEMAARHHVRRRSSSLDRDVSVSPQRPSLQRSSSFTSKLKRKDVEQVSAVKDVSEEISMKGAESINEDILSKDIGDKNQDGEMKLEEIVAVLKDIPDDSVKNQDDNKMLTLGVVRELQKQLNDLEQHLVQTRLNQSMVNTKGVVDKLDPSTNGATSRHEIFKDSPHLDLNLNGIESNFLNDNLSGRKSARERRREKLVVRAKESKDEVKWFNRTSMPYSSENLTAFNDNRHSLSTLADHNLQIQPNSVVKQSKTAINISENVKTTTFCKAEKDSKEISIETSLSINQRLKTTDDVSKTLLTRTHKTQRPSSMVKSQNAVVFEDRLSKIEIDNQNIKFEQKDMLGEGVFSQVFKGIYQGSQVAVKLLRAPLLSAEKYYFYSEVSLLQELRHPHVVMLLGICTSNPRPIMVLELMEGGNLFSRLHDLSLLPLSKSDVYQISRDVASGVSYLHHHKPPVLHLDLKSRNILLGHGGRAKIADFGFSKLKHEADLKISRASKSKTLSGSPAWMAPELLAAGEITVKADVYSFSIVLWEMVTRENPYDGFSMFQILEHVRLNKRLPLPPSYPQTLTQLIKKCWDPNPAVRPGFKDILKSLDTIFMAPEWLTWPGDSGKEEEDDDENTSTRTKDEENSYENNADQTEGINKAIKEMDVVTNSWNTIDVRSVCSDDMEHLQFDIDCSGQDNNMNDSERHTTHNNEIKKINGDNFSPRDFETKPRKSIEVTQVSTCVSSSSPRLVNVPSGLPVTSSRLVPSPRIREMAKKQAVERSSSVFLSHSLNVNKEDASSTMTTPRQSVGFPHDDDEELETLIKKYLPSPRNQSLIKQKPLTQSADASERLLPLRESLDKPRKHPKPRNIRSLPMSSQSLNFNNPPTTSDRFSLLDNTTLDAQRKRQREIDKETLQATKKEPLDLANTGTKRMSESCAEKNQPSYESFSHHTKYPNLRGTTMSPQHLTKDPQNVSSQTYSENISYGRIPSLCHVAKVEEPKNVDDIACAQVTDSSSVKSCPAPNNEDSAFLPVDTKKSKASENIPEIKRQTDLVEEVKEAKYVDNSQSAFESNSLLGIKYDAKRNNSLRFSNELQKKSTIIEEDNSVNNEAEKSFVEKKKDLRTEYEEIDANTSLNRQSCVDYSLESKNGALCKQKVNIILPVAGHLCKEDPQVNTYYSDSDSESSIHTDFSADSLSMTLSDDAESIDSLELASVDNKTRSRNKNKGSRTITGEIHNMESTESLAISPKVKKSSQEPKTRIEGVRESFFLFDDFQLVTDTKSKSINADNISNIVQSTDRNMKHKVRYVSSSDEAINKTDEHSFDPSILDVKSKKLNSFVSQRKQYNENHHNNNHKKRKSEQCEASTNQQSIKPLLQELQSFQKSDKENATNKERQAKPRWPAPPASSEEPGVRPSRSVLFSLEASMLVKQKNQLRSVAVQGPSVMKEVKKEMKSSMPSVASILKKAIEERRFALGDHLESQDITPEASWSIQE